MVSRREVIRCFPLYFTYVCTRCTSRDTELGQFITPSGQKCRKNGDKNVRGDETLGLDSADSGRSTEKITDHLTMEMNVFEL